MIPLDIYQSYPRKIARLDALKAIQKAVQRLQQGEDGPCTLDQAYAKLSAFHVTR